MTATAQQQLCQRWRKTLQDGRATLAARYTADRNGRAYLQAHSALVDGVIRSAWDVLGLGQRAALVAVGGYGRGQLFPHSDIDLLLLLPSATCDSLSSFVEDFIGAMWDIGLDVGHSVRTINECLQEAAKDITVATTLLENRMLAGNITLFHQLNSAVERNRDPLPFLEGKLLEQQQRHSKHYGLGSNLEPNIKESPGGLRDLHTILWISKAIGVGQTWDSLISNDILTASEARLLKYSERQLERIRIDLHLAAKRREDRLIFDLQNTVATMSGLSDDDARRASEQLMQTFYKASKNVSQLNGILLPNLRARYVCTVPRLTQDLDEHFYSVNCMLGIRDPDIFEKQPSTILSAFLHIQRHGLRGMAPRTLRALWHARRQINERFRRDPHNRALFMQFFKEPVGLTRTLRRMNLYGVLGKYLPAFGKIIGQMQHDLFHVYTVDEHILMVVRNLRRFAVPAFNHEYPLLSRLIDEFERPEVLYIAGLFHDIAKGRGGDHSQLGMADIRQFCEAHGMSAADTDLAEWLVAQHLTMSSVAQKQDIYDPQVVQEFAANVGDLRHLVALYILTVADIRGTSPKVWNAWKAKLLEDLFQATRRKLQQGGEVDLDLELAERKKAAQAILRLNAVPDGAEQALWQHVDSIYFLRHEAREIAWHARVLNRSVDTQTPIVRARLSEDKEGIELIVYAADQPDLFVRICAFLGGANYSIADAKIHTTRHGYALDTFHVFLPEHHDGDYRDLINFIEFELAANLQRQEPIRMPPPGRLSRHLKHFPIQPQVLIRADDKQRHYVLSIVSGDRPGLLAKIAKVLSDYHVNVDAAKIMTLGGRVEDSFLLSLPSSHDDKLLLALENDLINALRI
ncbi:[protein-PII] uridylyltransferase [Vogesella indigofera]|uniref:[protein-PII] uridylyltransferase n=1 Tax=Vogesella indigofera TaxID=45465 RepID=UPI00234E77BB|nr:[protein-PII] uridylyltransferase [Vogesella indigofera]MDC7698236.1 [protein-PII] uridylyltransferase [Vogesella indigofera]